MPPRPKPEETDLRPRRRVLSAVRERGVTVAAALEIPGELVLLLRVALPLASHRQRVAAIAFAVEDLVAEPIEALHVALGPEVGTGESLAAVVRHDEMATWAPRATAAGRRLVPETLALPVPAEGSWSVREADGRVIARLPDGTGFATRSDAFETFWRAGKRPQLVLFGGRLPPTVPVGATGLPPAGTGGATEFDLLQGRYAASKGGWRRLAPRFGALTAASLAAHLAILAGDAQILEARADAREGELRGALSERLGSLPASVPLDMALRRALPSGEPEAPRFLPLLAQTSEVLAPLAGQIGFRSLGYGAEDGALTVTLEAAGLPTIQRVERDLAASGLTVRAGAATTGNGTAEARLVIGGRE